MASHLIIAGHRGASGLVPHGNTLDAFVRSYEVGAGWVELDVRRLADGTLAVLHDPDLDGAPVRSLTIEQVREITERLGYQAPTLSEALACAKGHFCVDIELKELDTEIDAIAVAQQHLEPHEYVWTSFKDEVVASCKRRDPQAKAGLLLGLQAPQSARTRLGELFPASRLKACNADFVAPHFKLLRLGFLRRMRRAGYGVWVWTVNDRAALKRLIDLGVDAIITDYPDLAIQLRDGG